MKKKYLILIPLFILGIVFYSCDKQESSESRKEVVGMFQYLETPIYVKPYNYHKERKIVAFIFPGDSIDTTLYRFHITGNIPSEYKSNNTVKVRACIEDVIKGGTPLAGTPVYRLICMEKEE